MNVEIGAEAALFLEKEYISGIFVAVHPFLHLPLVTVDQVDHGLFSLRITISVSS
jgi:hypothetical protein